jgi:hypothetical protein
VSEAPLQDTAKTALKLRRDIQAPPVDSSATKATGGKLYLVLNIMDRVEFSQEATPVNSFAPNWFNRAVVAMGEATPFRPKLEEPAFRTRG